MSQRRRINGFTHLNLTKLDVLSKLETIKLCVGYKHNGQVSCPASASSCSKSSTQDTAVGGTLTASCCQVGVFCWRLILRLLKPIKAAAVRHTYFEMSSPWKALTQRFAWHAQDLPSVPSDLKTFSDVEVVWEEHPGWQQDISGARSWDELPDNAQKYIRWPPHGILHAIPPACVFRPPVLPAFSLDAHLPMHSCGG